MCFYDLFCPLKEKNPFSEKKRGGKNGTSGISGTTAPPEKSRDRPVIPLPADKKITSGGD